MFDRGEEFSAAVERAKRLLPRDRRLYAHLPYAFEVGDDVVRTRDNALMLSFEIAGIDGLTSSGAKIEGLRDQIARLLAGLDEKFCFYIHRLTRPARTGLTPLPGNGFAGDVERAWARHLAGQGLREFVTVVTIVRTMATEIRVPLFRRAADRLFREDTAARIASLREVASIFKGAVQRPVTDLRISDGALIGFYAALSSGVLVPEPRGMASLIAEDAATTAIEVENGAIRILEGEGAPRHAAVLYVAQNPLSTLPGMLDGIDEGANTIVSHSFSPIDRAAVTERALRRLAQMHGTAEIASIIEGQLVDTIDQVKAGHLGFGTHQMTVTVFAETKGKLDREVSRIRGIALQSGVRLTQDRTATEASFFAMHPGNMDYRCRTTTIWVERAGDRHMKQVDGAPWGAARIADLGLQIANSAGEKLTTQSPVVSTTIRTGDADLRAQVVVAPAVPGGAAISFRLFRGADRAAKPHAFSFLRDPFRSLEEERRDLITKVVNQGEGEDVDALLKAIIENRLNVIVSGGTSTGKTELGRRLLSLVDPAERIVTIEDSAELLPALPNVVSLIASREAESHRTADALLQASLRLRPDRIILGELRGSEAATFLDAINTGHSGSFTTIHAETARKAMERLALLVLATGTRLGFEDVIRYLANSIDVIIQMGHQNGQRGIMEVYFPGIGG